MISQIGRCLMAALVFCAFPALAQHRAFTVEDLAHMEDVGRAAVSPDGLTVAYETFGPWDQSSRFDLGPRANWTTGRVHLSLMSEGPQVDALRQSYLLQRPQPDRQEVGAQAGGYVLFFVRRTKTPSAGRKPLLAEG